MTVSTIISRVTYSPDGVVTAFAIPFPFYEDDDIEVIERTVATGAESTKVAGADYTVSGGDGSTGTVTAVAPPSATVQWVIRRATPLTQEIDYVENDPFPAETHEEGLDRAAMRIIDMQEQVDRAPKFPLSDPAASVADLPNSVDRSGRVAAYDGDGKPTVSTKTLAQIEATVGAPEAAAAAASAAQAIAALGGVQHAAAEATGAAVKAQSLLNATRRAIANFDLGNVILHAHVFG